MDGHERDGVVYVGGDGRQRFFDARGYGRPLADDERERWGANGVALSRVEAAHLLYRGDLDGIEADGRRLDVRTFLARAGDADGRDGAGFLVRFLVYADLRERGFYLSPARERWPNADRRAGGVDFLVYPRGSGPRDGTVEHRVRAVGEREPVAVDSLDGPLLAVVDEESDVTYFETRRPDVSGSADGVPTAGADGTLLSDRAVVWDPPEALYRRAFFGQPLTDGADGGPLQLSLVEAAYLAAAGAVAFDADRPSADRAPPSLSVGGGDGYAAVVARGRAVEGERFDRRLRAYAALRERGVVPKTGFKFGADFRTYAEFDSVDDLGHSELLVRAFPADRSVTPRDLALDVRLAHGVRKRMVFALVGGDGDGVAWRSASRLTP
jgi:tRNA-intron endonuclease